tara:strand:- start:295 stop:444 length:150 start_codon:yes stop_codon:yes gene_type:complete
MAAPIFTIVGEYKTHEEAKTKLRGFSIIEDSEDIKFHIVSLPKENQKVA